MSIASLKTCVVVLIGSVLLAGLVYAGNNGNEGDTGDGGKSRTPLVPKGQATNNPHVSPA